MSCSSSGAAAGAWPPPDAGIADRWIRRSAGSPIDNRIAGGHARFKKILGPLDIDYPEIAAGVYRKATAIAEMSHAAIRLVTVMPGFTMPIVDSLVPEEVRKEVARRVKAAVDQFIVDYCDPAVAYSLETGKNWAEIIEEADQWQADLIIVYHNRHREVNDLFSHSCSQRVADHAHCSVRRLRNVQAPA